MFKESDWCSFCPAKNSHICLGFVLIANHTNGSWFSSWRLPCNVGHPNCWKVSLPPVFTSQKWCLRFLCSGHIFIRCYVVMLPAWQGQSSDQPVLNLVREVVVQTGVVCVQPLGLSLAVILTTDGRSSIYYCVNAAAATFCVALPWGWSWLLWKLLTCSPALVMAVSLPRMLQWEGIHCKTARLALQREVRADDSSFSPFFIYFLFNTFKQTNGTTEWPYWSNSSNTKPEETNKLTTTTKQITYAKNQIYTKLHKIGAHTKTLAVALKV